MFGTVLTVTMTAMQLYVFWRAGSAPLLQRRLPRGFLIGIGLLLWAGFVLSRNLGHGSSGCLATALELYGMHWMAVLFLATVCLLAVDLVTGFGWWLSRMAPRLRGWALLAGATLSVIALVQGRRPPVVQRYEVCLPGLPPELDGTVLVALSDLHLGALLGRPWLEARVARQAEQAAAAGVGLLLSGHTHGGQLWPFGYLVQRVNPMLGGRYELADGVSAIVCRGTGTWGPRMRLWRPGEILRVTLRFGSPSPPG